MRDECAKSGASPSTALRPGDATSWAALLRGINVHGTRILPMDALAQVLAANGHASVRTSRPDTSCSATLGPMHQICQHVSQKPLPTSSAFNRQPSCFLTPSFVGPSSGCLLQIYTIGTPGKHCTSSSLPVHQNRPTLNGFTDCGQPTNGSISVMRWHTFTHPVALVGPASPVRRTCPWRQRHGPKLADGHGVGRTRNRGRVMVSRSNHPLRQTPITHQPCGLASSGLPRR